MSTTAPRLRDRERGRLRHLLGQHLPLVIALTLVTVTGTITTFEGVRIQGEANGADADSVTETQQLANRQINAMIAARALQGLAGQYVTMLSQADAIAKTDPAEAEVERRSARDFAIRGQFLGFLSAQSATATFNYHAAYASELTLGDVTAVPSNGPGTKAARADRDHHRVRVLALDVVGFLGVIVLITLARVSNVRRRRMLFDGLAGVAYAGLVLIAVLQVW